MSRVYEPRIWGAFSPAGQADCQGVCTHFPKLTSPYKITFTVEERTEKAKPSALISLTPPFMFSFSSHLHSLSNLLITFESHSVKPLCVLTDTGVRNLVNFFCFFYAHMYIYFSRVLSGRCSCFCCLHASFSVCGGMLLAETMESCLRVIRSNSAWTSVKPGFCPWKKRQETKPKSNLL